VQARLARYEIELEKIDEAVESFREAGRELAQLEGYQGGHLLVDHEEGALLTLTLWTDRATMDRSEVRAAGLRQRALRAVDGDVQSVTSYEVPFDLG
jgi:heme-degrading monooxygenase HmoA